VFVASAIESPRRKELFKRQRDKGNSKAASAVRWCLSSQGSIRFNRRRLRFDSVLLSRYGERGNEGTRERGNSNSNSRDELENDLISKTKHRSHSSLESWPSRAAERKRERERRGLCRVGRVATFAFKSSSANPAGDRPCEYFGHSYSRTVHLIASNRSVRICANPAIVDGAPSWRIASGRICRICFPSASNWLSVRRLSSL